MQHRPYIVLLLLVVLFVVVRYGGFWGVGEGVQRGLSAEHRAFCDSIVRPTSVRAVSSTVVRKSPRVFSLDLNTANSTQLQAVYGIGEVFAQRIIEYRNRLGGYYSVGQLREVRGINSEVYQRIHQNFYIKSSGYNKISINFALPSGLSGHPYFSKSMVRRIEKAKLKGGVFTSLQELIDQDILLHSEAHRVSAYLSFTTSGE